MPEESTTPNLGGFWRRLIDAMNAGDADAVMDFYAPDAVNDMPETFGTSEGRAAIRALFEDWLGPYDEFRVEVEAIRDLGNGVTFGVVVLRGRPRDSTGWVQFRFGVVHTVVDGLIARSTAYGDIDEARAAAERLARGRGLRAINAWNRQDLPGFLETWDEDAEWRPAFPAGTEGSGAVFRGRAEIARAWRGVREAWTEYRVDVHDARTVGDAVLVLGRIHARGAHSDIEINSEWSAVVRVRDGKAISAWDWLDHDHALKAVGLEE
jgi:ketosteroid isomerase-like protein